MCAWCMCALAGGTSAPALTLEGIRAVSRKARQDVSTCGERSVNLGCDTGAGRGAGPAVRPSVSPGCCPPAPCPSAFPPPLLPADAARTRVSHPPPRQPAPPISQHPLRPTPFASLTPFASFTPFATETPSQEECGLLDETPLRASDRDANKTRALPSEGGALSTAQHRPGLLSTLFLVNRIPPGCFLSILQTTPP